MYCNSSIFKGQIISKRLFLVEHSPKKRTKTRRILVKTNSFVRLLEESSTVPIGRIISAKNARAWGAMNFI